MKLLFYADYENKSDDICIKYNSEIWFAAESVYIKKQECCDFLKFLKKV
jgi:hypothetical protein